MVVVVRNASATAKAHILSFFALWVATLIILRISVPLVLSGMKCLRRYRILCDELWGTKAPVPGFIIMFVRKQPQRKASVCTHPTSSTTVEDGSVVSTSSEQTESSTISSSSSLREDEMVVNSVADGFDVLRQSSSSSSYGPFIGENKEKLMKSSILPEYLRWIDEPVSSSESSQLKNEGQRNMTREAFKCRRTRRMRVRDKIVHLSDDSVEIHEQKGTCNSNSFNNAVLPRSQAIESTNAKPF